MPLTQDLSQLKADYDTHGYAILRGLLSQGEVADFNRRIERYLAEHRDQAMADKNIFLEDKDDPDSILRLQYLHKYEPWFDSFTREPRFVDLAQLFLAEPVEPQVGQMFGKPARVGKETPPHQDGYYFKLTPPNALTIWIALQDVNPGAGGLAYIPGSHRTGLRHHEISQTFGFSLGIEDLTDSEKASFVCPPIKAGDAFVHHCLTIHAAGANPSDHHRNAYGLTYYGQSARPDAQAHAAHNARIREDWQKQARI